MTQDNLAPEEHRIIDQPFTEILSDKYLSYALSTIMSRSLPDVRDGLKPVHRRLLYAMFQLKLSAQSGPKKCARVVGDVIGKFHPHGDQAVYDALVRLAQDFAVRYPLIDGQGNFGNIDGDNAAAMRYTEAKLTPVAELLLDGINEDAVDFRTTYDGEMSEPIVLPSNFPNLLANGASGIAVGMATNIPPHNIIELCDAMALMLDSDEEPSVADLVKIVKGPDFPTGGKLVEPEESILEAYETGRGSFRLRARWEKEDLGQGQYQIIVTEMPYQVQKSRLIEKIADLIQKKSLPMLDDVRDESAEDVRLVLVPKSRNVDPELLMEALYRNTALEVRFAMNMNVLDGGTVPQVMNLKEVLQAWLMHRQEVLVRRSTFRLDKVEHRIEVLDGYLIVFLNIDEVIRIIREGDDPKTELMQAFGLSEIQVEAILNMRLRSLHRLEEIQLRTEHDSLSKERDTLKALIKSEARQWKEIRKQIGDLKKSFADNPALSARRTELAEAPVAVDISELEEAMIEKEPVTVICSKKGWIRAMKGHGHDPENFSFKDGDSGRFALEAQTTDKLIFMDTEGRFFSLGCDDLPSARGYGEPIRLMADLSNDADIASMKVYDSKGKLLVVAEDGRGFIVKESDVFAQTRTGKQILNVKGKIRAKLFRKLNADDDHLAIMGTNRKLLVFPLDEVPEMGRGRGVILQRYSKGGVVADIKSFNLEQGLSYKYAAGETTVEDIMPWMGKRSQVGRLPPNGFPRDNKFD